jgi:hypothetical protein
MQIPEENMKKKLIEQFLNIHESMLRAQINVIRQFRREAGIESVQPKPEKGMSQVDMIYDILRTSNEPIHIDQLIAAAQEKFKIKMDKESVVSALAKRIKRHDRFVKTAPNTYFLIDQKAEGGPR